MPGFYLPSEEEYDPKSDDFVPLVIAKERNYRHFDLPLENDDRELEVDFSCEGSPHRFLPLLGYTDVSRRYLKNDKGEKKVKIKRRPIRFAGHADAAYLQAYTDFISPIYEEALVRDGTSSAVLAYRRGGGTNIHHAKTLFDEISARGDCTVVAIDISGFFDCLNHEHLKYELLRLLGESRLTGHHWTVFNSITRYSWVESEDIDSLLGKKRPRNGRVCTHNDFLKHVRGRKSGLVRTHYLDYGIPQGTPISGLYANFYLRTFDTEISQMVAGYGGSYRRYSDDIAIVLPGFIREDRVVSIVEKLISDFHLSLSVDKTESAQFSAGLLSTSKPIQYLGFTFDGERKLIRPSSLDAYRAKMEDGIHAKLVASKMQGISSLNVYKREVLSRYTHKGKRRNFIHYAYKSAGLLHSPEIRQQVKDHVHWFNRTWDREVVKVYGGLVLSSP